MVKKCRRLWVAFLTVSVLLAGSAMKAVKSSPCSVQGKEAQTSAANETVNRPQKAPQTLLAKELQKPLQNRVAVWLLADGKEGQLLKVTAVTVGKALKAANVDLGPHDRVTPPPSTLLKPGMVICIVRVTVEQRVVHKPLPREVRIRLAPLPGASGSRVVDEGQDGIVEERLMVYLKDGVETIRKVVGRRVIKPPRPKVIQMGLRGSLPSRGSAWGRRVLTMTATAYDPGPRSCGRSADGVTATGMRARRGVVAVDPRVIRLGSRLYVEGYGFAIAADEGSAIKGMRIDLCFNTYKEAIRFGRRKVRVLVLE